MTVIRRQGSIYTFSYIISTIGLLSHIKQGSNRTSELTFNKETILIKCWGKNRSTKRFVIRTYARR